MMLACRRTAERHQGLSQGYIRQHRLADWFRGWLSRSAPLESQEAAGQGSIGFDGLNIVCMQIPLD